MGGSTVVLVEAALQDLMWHYTRVRCPPSIIEHTRQRLQRLMSDVSLSESVKASEAEETTTDFCSGIILDVVDDILYTKIPFVEVDRVEKELERVSFVNEVLKLKVEEKDELDHLRQLSLSRKDDALVYTVHKYFEEVFLLRKERATLTSLLRESQRRVKKLEVQRAGNRNNNNGNSPGISTYNSLAGGTFASILQLGDNQHQQPNGDSLAATASFQQSAFFNAGYSLQPAPRGSNQLYCQNYTNQPLQAALNTTYANNVAAMIQQNQNFAAEKSFSESTTPARNNNNNIAIMSNPNNQDSVNNDEINNSKHYQPSNKITDFTTMAIFSYDELATRMMLSDPDLATLKLHNLKLVRELEQNRIKFGKQKREMMLKYETKIKQLENKLAYLLDEEDAETRERERNVKIHVRHLRPLRLAIRGVSEGFDTAKYAIRDAIVDFGNAFMTAKNAIDESMQQVLVNEEICSNHVNYATEYMNALCENVGKIFVEDDEEDEENKQKTKNESEENKNSDETKEKEKLVDTTSPKSKTNNDLDDKSSTGSSASTTQSKKITKEKRIKKSDDAKKESLNNINNNNNSSSTAQTIPKEEPKESRQDPVKTARLVYESCLEINAFDDGLTAKSKQYFRQHDVSAFMRSSVASVTQNVEHFSELLRRLKLLSDYATKERSLISMYEMSKCHDELLQKKRKLEREKILNKLKNSLEKQEAADNKAAENASDQQKGEDEDDDNSANPTLVALSAATRVATNRKLYLRLFELAKMNKEEGDHEYYGLDQRMTTTEEQMEEMEKHMFDKKKEKRDRKEKKKLMEKSGDDPLVDLASSSCSDDSVSDSDSDEDGDNARDQLHLTQPILSDFITTTSQGSYKKESRRRVQLIFRRIAARCARSRRMDNYESFHFELVPEVKTGGDATVDGEEDDNFFDDDDAENAFKNEKEKQKEKENSSSTPATSLGPFSSEDSYQKWKKQLQRVARREDEKFTRRIIASKERTKRIVTECISKLPSSLLVKIIMERHFKPNAYNSGQYDDDNIVVPSTWHSPFGDFDFTHIPEKGEDWATNYNKHMLKMINENSESNNDNKENNHNNINNNNKNIPSITSSSLSGDGRSFFHGPRHLRVTCPECGKRFLASLPSNFSQSGHLFSKLKNESDKSSLIGSNRRNTMNSIHPSGSVDGDEESLEKSKKLKRLNSTASTVAGLGSTMGTTNNNDTDSNMASQNCFDLDDADGSENKMHSFNGNRSTNNTNKKVLRFSPHIHEVSSESMIPIAAAANRQGFFAAFPPSHFVGKMISQNSLNVENNNNNNNNNNNSSEPVMMNSLFAQGTSSHNSNGSLNNLHSASSTVRPSGDPFLDSIFRSPAPRSILRGSDNNSNNKKPSLPVSGNDPDLESKNNAKGNKRQNSAGKFSSVSVNGNVSSTISLENVPLDDDGEERLLLVTKLRTKFGTDVDAILSSQPCVIPSAAVGNIPNNLISQSYQLSAQGVAKQFVRRKYQEQLLVSQMIAMQEYLKRLKLKDQQQRSYDDQHSRGFDDDENVMPSTSSSMGQQKNNQNTSSDQEKKSNAASVVTGPSPPPKRPASSAADQRYRTTPTTLESLSNLGLSVIDPRKR